MRAKVLLLVCGFILGLAFLIGCNDDGVGASTGTTVSGFITTTATDPPFTVRLLQGTDVLQTQTGIEANETFTFTNVEPGDNYFLSATAEGIETLYGPFTVPPQGVSGINFNARSAAELQSEGVTIPPTAGTATAVVFVPGGATITVEGDTSPNGNPAVLPGIEPGIHTVTITVGTDTFTTVVDFPADTVVVLRSTLIPAPAGVTVSGTVDANDIANFTVALLKDSTQVGETQTVATGGTFTFNNVQPGEYFVTASTGGVTTVFGPFTVGSENITDITLDARLASDLEGNSVPFPPATGTATAVVFIEGGGTITVAGDASIEGNPAFVEGVEPGVRTVEITDGTSTATFDFDFPTDTAVVFLPAFPV